MWYSGYYCQGLFNTRFFWCCVMHFATGNRLYITYQVYLLSLSILFDTVIPVRLLMKITDNLVVMVAMVTMLGFQLILAINKVYHWCKEYKVILLQSQTFYIMLDNNGISVGMHTNGNFCSSLLKFICSLSVNRVYIMII